jgi:hypothetical protein
MPMAAGVVAEESGETFRGQLSTYTDKQTKLLLQKYDDQLALIANQTREKLTWFTKEFEFMEKVFPQAEDRQRLVDYIQREAKSRAIYEAVAFLNLTRAFNKASPLIYREDRTILGQANARFRRSGVAPAPEHIAEQTWRRTWSDFESTLSSIAWTEQRRRQDEYVSFETLIELPEIRTNTPQPEKPKFNFDERTKTLIKKLERGEVEQKRPKNQGSAVKTTYPKINSQREFVIGPPVTNNLLVLDRFGRDIRNGGFLLVDWDGYMANPAMPFYLRAAPGAGLPLQVKISASEPRLFFDEPSEVGSFGPFKSLVYGTDKKNKLPIIIKDYDQSVRVFLEIWPDRDQASEETSLRFTVTETKWVPPPPVVDLPPPPPIPGQPVLPPIVTPQFPAAPQTCLEENSFSVPVYVLDQDKKYPPKPMPEFFAGDTFPLDDHPSDGDFVGMPFPYIEDESADLHPWPFTVNIDYTQDKSEFFRLKKHRQVVQQVVQDWAYFFDDMNFEEVPKGAEVTDILAQGAKVWSDGELKQVKFKRKNASKYRDFLLYVLGADSNPQGTGVGLADGSGFQRAKGSWNRTTLKRSGSLLIERVKFENRFTVDLRSETWHEARYTDSTPIDLYSIMLHEVGHSLFWEKVYAPVGDWQNQGTIRDLVVQDYIGYFPTIGEKTTPDYTPATNFEQMQGHLSSEVDRASRRGAFGAVRGKMPHHRWLITKLDLLLAEAVGYTVRKTSAFQPLEVSAKIDFLPGYVGRSYVDRVVATGGVPHYNWSVIRGNLPDGLYLNSFTGEMVGTPIKAGRSQFLLAVEDQMGDRKFFADSVVVY